jgi:hypothetical protein
MGAGGVTFGPVLVQGQCPAPQPGRYLWPPARPARPGSSTQPTPRDSCVKRWIRAGRWIGCTGGQRIRCGARTGRRALRGPSGGPRQPHPHLLAHEFQMTGFTWEYSGLREDFGYRDAQKTPRSQNPPRRGVPRRARVSGHPQVPVSRRGMTAAAWGAAPGACTPDGAGDSRRQLCRLELDCRLDGQPPRGPDISGLGTRHRNAPDRHSARSVGRCAGRMAGFPSLTRTCWRMTPGYQLRPGLCSRHDGELGRAGAGSGFHRAGRI